MSDSWQEIDGDGVLMGWEHVAFKDADLFHYLEAMRRAVNERLCNQTKFTHVIQKMENISFYLAQYHDKISQFINRTQPSIFRYVNYADNAGNWEGLTAIPTWTEADALAEIGHTERVKPKISNIQAWLIQNYKLLNLCKWHKSGLAAGILGYVNEYRRIGTGANAVAALANYDIATWTRSGANTPARAGVYYSGATAVVDNHRAWLAMSPSYANNDIQASADLYTMGQLWQAGEYGNNTPCLHDDEGKYKLFSGWWAEGGAVAPGYFRIGDYLEFDKPSEYLPSEGVSCVVRVGTAGGGDQHDRTVCIEKFDGANGFKFRGEDW